MSRFIARIPYGPTRMLAHRLLADQPLGHLPAPRNVEDLGPAQPLGLLAMLERGIPETVVDVGYLASLIDREVWANAVLMDVMYGPYTATDWMVWVGGVVQTIRRHARPLHEPPAPAAIRIHPSALNPTRRRQ